MFLFMLYKLLMLIDIKLKLRILCLEFTLFGKTEIYSVSKMFNVKDSFLPSFSFWLSFIHSFVLYFSLFLFHFLCHSFLFFFSLCFNLFLFFPSLFPFLNFPFKGPLLKSEKIYIKLAQQTSKSITKT